MEVDTCFFTFPTCFGIDVGELTKEEKIRLIRILLFRTIILEAQLDRLLKAELGDMLQTFDDLAVPM